jgi:hypothetical protein
MDGMDEMDRMDGMERDRVGICCGLRAVIRWYRVAQPPVTGWHPCRGADLSGVVSGGVARAELNHRLGAVIPAG